MQRDKDNIYFGLGHDEFRERGLDMSSYIAYNQITGE
jgi:hypothetical protein